MNGLELYDKVRSVPENAKKEIKGGRMSGKTDINPMWRIKVLTEQFGPCGIGWYYIPIRKWLETHGDEVAAFVDIELYVKVAGEWSKPIFGTGGSMFSTKEAKGIYVSDECYKMATTDAISVSCKQLGIGADVYWDKDRTKYDSTLNAIDAKAAEQIKKIYAELARTGIGKNNLCKNYGAESIEHMTADQRGNALNVLSQKADKPLDPATIPPDDPECGLPFNTPAR